ncbi:hypothetical protein D9M68_890970 [compost metagenome]
MSSSANQNSGREMPNTAVATTPRSIGLLRFMAEIRPMVTPIMTARVSATMVRRIVTPA